MRPRTDAATPSRPSASASCSRCGANPTPSSRTVTRTSSSASSRKTHARAPGPACWATFCSAARTAAAISAAVSGGQRWRLGRRGHAHPITAQGAQRGAEIRQRVLVTGGDQCAQPGLLRAGLAGEPAPLTGVVAAGAMHQAQHLQHPVVHGAGQPFPLQQRGARGDRLGEFGLRADGERTDVADHAAGEQQHDRVEHRPAVVAGAHHDRRHRLHERRDQAAAPAEHDAGLEGRPGRPERGERRHAAVPLRGGLCPDGQHGQRDGRARRRRPRPQSRCARPVQPSQPIAAVTTTIAAPVACATAGWA